MARSPLHDVIDRLIDRASFHDEHAVNDMHDSVTAHAEGFDSLEAYRKDQADKAKAAGQPVQPQQSVALSDDAILDRADAIRRARGESVPAQNAAPQPAAQTPVAGAPGPGSDQDAAAAAAARSDASVARADASRSDAAAAQPSAATPSNAAV